MRSFPKLFFLSLCLLIQIISLGAEQKELRVAVYLSPPFGMQAEDSTFSGLAVEMWEGISSELGWTNYSYHGDDIPGIIRGLNNEQYDLAIGALTITPEREALVDFTHAVNPSGTGFAIGKNKSGNSFWTSWKPIFVNLSFLALVLFGGIVLFGTIIWMVEMRWSRHVEHDKKIMGLGESIWWAVVTMSTVGYGDKVPLSRAGKGIAIVWIFTSIIMASLFTAKASSIFTLNTIEMEIRGDNDLRNSKVGAARLSSGEDYCKRRNIPYKPYESIEKALEDVINGQLDAVVSNVLVLRYHKLKTYGKDLKISPQLLVKNNMGIALPTNSPLREDLNVEILIESGEMAWRQRIEKYLGEY